MKTVTQFVLRMSTALVIAAFMALGLEAERKRATFKATCEGKEVDGVTYVLKVKGE